MLEIILHTVIDDLRGNESKVFKINNKILSIPETKKKRWWERISVWITVAKLVLPMAYMLVALAIVMVGVINILVEGSW